MRVVPGATQDHSLHKTWTRLTSCGDDRGGDSGGEEGRGDRRRHGGEARGGGSVEDQEVAADDGRQAHTFSTMSASEVHPKEFVGVRVPGTMDLHGFKRVGYWQNVIVRTVASSRSDLAAQTFKVADLQPHQLADRRQPLSNKRTRRMEDDAAVGGMRNPAIAIHKLPGWVRVGTILRKTIEDYMLWRPW